MAIQDVIKRLIYQFTSTGADKVAADMGKVNTEQGKLAVTAETATKSSLNLTASFDKLERRFDSTIRAQQDYQKVQEKVNAAVAANPALQERANSVLAKAAEQFEKAGKSSSAYSTALGEARGAAVGLAAGIGPLGAVLGSFGPWGMAAAAGIGLVTQAFTYLHEAAGKMGDEAVKLKQFSDVSGLTTQQVRGLTEAGQELGVGAEAITGALSKFTVNLDAARKGSGDLYEQLRDIDKQLAIQVGATRSTAEALNLLAKAYNATVDATTKAALSRAAFGKGGVAAGPVLGVLDDAGGVDKYSKDAAEALGVTDEWTKSVAKLRNQIKDVKGDIETMKGGIFSKEVLEAELALLKAEYEIIRQARDAKQPGTFDLSKGVFPLQISQPAITGEAGRGGMIRDTEAHTKAIEDNERALRENNLAMREIATESQHLVTALGSAATAAEKEEARVDALTAAFVEGKISVETYYRALDANPVLVGIEKITEQMREQNELAKVAGTSREKSLAAQMAYEKVIKEIGDTEAGRAAAQERSDAVAESYRIKIKKAADSTAAAALSAATLENRMAGAANNAARYADAVIMVQNPPGSRSSYTQPQAGTEGGQMSYLTSPGQMSTSTYSVTSDPRARVLTDARGYESNASRDPTFQAGWNALLMEQVAKDKERNTTEIEALAQTALTQSIDDLTESTDSLNATNQELLSPYYTQDPRTSHIGFRSQGMAAGGYVDVPGSYSANDNMLAMVPVASGERIYVDPMTSRRGGAGGTTINISAPMTFAGPVNRDEVGRTVYQTMQNTARSIQAAAR